MTTNRVRAVQDLRRSGAAGPHSRRSTRADQLAAALADWDDLTLLANIVRDLRARLDQPGRAVLERVLDEYGVEVER